MKKTLATIAAGTMLMGGVVLTDVSPCTSTISMRDFSPNERAETVRTKIKNKDLHERVSIKADAIVADALTMKKEFKRADSGYCIDIDRVEKIDGGIQVFARAWKDGKQLGFGSDGSVEIERFRFFNPPLLVEDPNGDIIDTSTDSLGNTTTRRLREDPEEALREMLIQTVAMVGKEGSNIVPGKEGRTTSTFYPSEDGVAFCDGVGASWATKQSCVGNSRDRTSANERTGYYRRDSGSWTNVGRAFFGFDTSAIGDTDTISSATFSLYGTTYENGSFGTEETLIIDRSVPQSESAIATTDYDKTRFAGVLQSNTTIARNSWNTAGYNDFTLNATGLSNISKTANTWLNPRMQSDFNNVEPGSLTNGARSFGAYFSEQTGTTNDPKLVVVHEAAATPGGFDVILFE